MQVPINITSAPASVNSDMSTTKASTKASTIPATALLLICVRYSRKIGISKAVTATQTAMSLPTMAILDREKE